MAAARPKVRVALFGFGRMGRIHFNTLLINRHRVEILYLVDAFTDNLNKAQVEFDLATTQVVHSDQTAAVLEDSRLDGIIICTPTETHTPLILQAFKAGKHVMCEKPIALSAEEIQTCYKAASQVGRHLFCALNRRFDPGYQKIKQQVGDGSVGHIQLLQYFCRDHPEPPAATLQGLGNFVTDMGVHMLDTVSWMMGEKPSEVFTYAHAHNQSYKERGDFDVFGTMLKFPSGAIAYTDTCRYAPYGYDQRLEVVGSKGALHLDTPLEDGVVRRDPQGETRSPMQFSFPERFKDSYRLETEHFIDILSGQVENSISEDAVVSIGKMCEAASQSAQTGLPVKINY